MNEGDWVQMKFDPQQIVNVRDMIRVMRGEIATLNKDQWEDTKECCADVMEQFLEMRRDAEKLDSNLRNYVTMHNDIEGQLIRTNRMEAYRAFKAKQRAE
jgi:hypothetical protein